MELMQACAAAAGSSNAASSSVLAIIAFPLGRIRRPHAATLAIGGREAKSRAAGFAGRLREACGPAVSRVPEGCKGSRSRQALVAIAATRAIDLPIPGSPKAMSAVAEETLVNSERGMRSG